MTSARFPKRLRLLRAAEFERVLAARNSVAGPRLILHGAKNELEHPRLGMTVSRRVGNAVVRNRWKRLIREGFRSLQHRLPPLDYVCIARGSEPPSLQAICDDLQDFAAKLERRSKSANRRGSSSSPARGERM